MYHFKTTGVCSKEIQIELDGETIKSVHFVGGCNGNTKGIAALVQGMNARDVIARVEDIKCGPRNTSCPAQLAQALKEMLG